MQLKIDEIDNIMAVFTWDSTRIVDSLNDEQKKLMRSVLNKYQIYVISDSGYTRHDKMERISELSKETNISMKDYKSYYQFRELVKKSLINDFETMGLVRKDSTKDFKEKRGRSIEDDEIFNKPKRLVVMGFDDNSIPFGMGDDGDSDSESESEEQIQEPVLNTPNQKAMKKDVDYKVERSELFDNKKEQIDNSKRILQMLVILQEKMEKQDAMLNHLMNRAEIQGTGTQLDGTSAIEQMRATKKMTKDLEKLTEMQLKNQDITQVSFQDLPEWFRSMYRQGLKRGAISMVKLPFKTSKGIVNYFACEPMGMVAKFYGGKFQFVLGHIEWFMVISGVVYIYTSNHYDTLNNYYNNYGGKYVKQIFIDPGFMIINKMRDVFPGLSEIVEGYGKFMWNNAIPYLLGLPKKGAMYCLDWFTDAVAEAIGKKIPVFGRFF